MFRFADGGGGAEDMGVTKLVIFCGLHKCMTPELIKITINPIIRGSSFFFFNIKPPARYIFDCVDNNPPAPSPTHAPPHSTDDQTKAPVTFNWHLIFYVKKCFDLLIIASWLASNKPPWNKEV